MHFNENLDRFFQSHAQIIYKPNNLNYGLTHLKKHFLPPRKESLSRESHHGKTSLQAPSHFGNVLYMCSNAFCNLRGSEPNCSTRSRKANILAWPPISSTALERILYTFRKMHRYFNYPMWAPTVWLYFSQ